MGEEEMMEQTAESMATRLLSGFFVLIQTQDRRGFTSHQSGRVALRHAKDFGLEPLQQNLILAVQDALPGIPADIFTRGIAPAEAGEWLVKADAWRASSAAIEEARLICRSWVAE